MTTPTHTDTYSAVQTHFPLKERIGHPDLYVYRQTQWEDFLNWTRKIPKMVSKSRAILARKKSGKTAFVQRLFNHLWQENGSVLPFYFEISESKQWLGNLAMEGEPDSSLPGIFHGLSESKIAPMLVTGSYIGWLMNIIRQHLEGARLKIFEFPTAMAPEESLEVALRLSEHLEVPVTNATALQIAEMCRHDPFFIRCLIDSSAPDLDLTTERGVQEGVKYEIMSNTSENQIGIAKTAEIIGDTKLFHF